MKSSAVMAILLAAACGCSSPSPSPSPVASPAPGSQPIANGAPAPAPAPAPPPAPSPPPAPTCIPPDVPIVDARLEGGVLAACYVVPQPSGYVDDCWRFDLATSAWSFTSRRPHAGFTRPSRNVTATATSARACTLDGSDCKTIPLSGIKVSPDDELAGATNLDRSIVAVWVRGDGPVHVFDASGKRLATIQPWAAGMRGDDPSWFREAHVLGSTIEVRIADSPISSAIRLYDARGRKIADVFGGQAMQDTDPPLALGGSRYAFVTLDPRILVITDVVTGKQLGTYPIPGSAGELHVLMRTPDGNLAGVIGPSAVRLDVAAGKLTTVAGPTCAP